MADSCQLTASQPHPKSVKISSCHLRGARYHFSTKCGYNGHMRAVQVAELKNQLSSFLHRVRAGEELLIRDRNLPIAKIVPLREEEMELDEVSLVASGQMTLPRKKFDAERFWAIGEPDRKDPKLKKA